MFFFLGGGCKGWLWIEFEYVIVFGAILGICNRDKEKEGDKGHIMHYKLVVGVQVCLGQCVTKIRRQNDKDKETKWNKKYNIYVTQIYQNKIVNVWLVFLWDNKYNFYFISKSWENQLQYLIFFQKKRFKFNIYGCSCEFIWYFFFRLSPAPLALNPGFILGTEYWLESAVSHGAAQTVSLTWRCHKPPSRRLASATTDPRRCHCPKRLR